MPDRTKEEIEQIRKDFIEIKKLWDQKLEKIPPSYPNPFNNRSRKEEVEDLFNSAIKSLRNLTKSGKVKSCEALSMLEDAISESVYDRDNPSWWVLSLGVEIRKSHKKEVIEDLSLDKLVSMLNTNSIEDVEINQVLDKIGKSACTPRAHNDKETLSQKKSEVFKT